VKTKDILIVILHTLSRFVVPFIALIACLFMRKTDRKTTHYEQDGNIQRYRLPSLFKFMETLDEDLMGGLYEPTVKKIYDKFGAYWCSVYWIGLRNQAQGLLWTRGYEVNENDYKMNKILKDQGEYLFDHKEFNFRLFRLVFEYEVVHDHYRDYTTTGYYCIPKLSFKRK